MSLTDFIKNKHTLSQLSFIKPLADNVFPLYKHAVESVYYSCPVLWVKNLFEPTFNYIQLTINGKIIETIYPSAFPILYKKLEQHIVKKGDWIYIPLPFMTLWNDCIKQTEHMDCVIRINTDDILINAELQVFHTFVQQDSAFDRLSAIIRCIPTGGFDFIQTFNYVQMQHALLEPEIELVMANRINELCFQISDLNGNIVESVFDGLTVFLNGTAITSIDEQRLGIFKIVGNYYSVPLFGGYGDDSIDMNSNNIKLKFHMRENTEMNYKVVIIAFSKTVIKYFENNIVQII